MCDTRGLTSCVRGPPCGPAQVSGRAHGTAARRTGLHHPDLATHPSAGMLNRFAWSRVIRPYALEEVQHVLSA